MILCGVESRDVLLEGVLDSGAELADSGDEEIKETLATSSTFTDKSLTLFAADVDGLIFSKPGSSCSKSSSVFPVLLSVRFWFEVSSLTTEMLDFVFSGAEVVSVKFKKDKLLIRV